MWVTIVVFPFGWRRLNHNLSKDVSHPSLLIVVQPQLMLDISFILPVSQNKLIAEKHDEELEQQAANLTQRACLLI